MEQLTNIPFSEIVSTIAGLGLIGGSLAKAIKSRTKGHSIYAVAAGNK